MRWYPAEGTQQPALTEPALCFMDSLGDLQKQLWQLNLCLVTCLQNQIPRLCAFVRCLSGVAEMAQLWPEALASEVEAFEESCKRLEIFTHTVWKCFSSRWKQLSPVVKTINRLACSSAGKGSCCLLDYLISVPAPEFDSWNSTKLLSDLHMFYISHAWLCTHIHTHICK